MTTWMVQAYSRRKRRAELQMDLHHANAKLSSLRATKRQRMAMLDKEGVEDSQARVDAQELRVLELKRELRELEN